MKLAIISDIHDNLEKLRLAVQRCAKDGECTLCCGDLCSPFVIKELGLLPHPVHIVFGNNDADLFRITRNAAAFPHLVLHGEYAELELGGKLIALSHFDNIARALARGNTFDVVCFGHNHTYEATKLERTLLINPGEIFGKLKGASTFALYDTTSNAVQRIEL